MPKITRKPKIRLQGYDYSQSNYYFITTCTQNRQNWFGEIKNQKMILNFYGKICLEHLQNLPNHYNNIKIDTFVIMPNHVHVIIVINQNDKSTTNGQGLALSLQNKSLSKILNDFKSFSSQEINKLMTDDKKFKWQRSFYDHVIRNERSLQKIREYITNNPINWAHDKENLSR
jgi:putative transposase